MKPRTAIADPMQLYPRPKKLQPTQKTQLRRLNLLMISRGLITLPRGKQTQLYDSFSTGIPKRNILMVSPSLPSQGPHGQALIVSIESIEVATPPTTEGLVISQE